MVKPETVVRGHRTGFGCMGAFFPPGQQPTHKRRCLSLSASGHHYYYYFGIEHLAAMPRGRDLLLSKQGVKGW